MDAECGSSFSFVRIIFQARVNKVFFVKFYNGEKKLVSQFAQFQLYSLFGHIFYVVSWLSTKLSLPFKLGCKTVILIKFVFSYFYKLKDVLLPTVFNLLMMRVQCSKYICWHKYYAQTHFGCNSSLRLGRRLKTEKIVPLQEHMCIIKRYKNVIKGASKKKL